MHLRFCTNLLDLRVTFSIYHLTTFLMTLVIYDTKLQVTWLQRSTIVDTIFEIDDWLIIFYFPTLISQKHFHLHDFNKHKYDAVLKTLGKEEAKRLTKFINGRLSSAVYLQVSTISQALIFVTRSRGWSFTERPGSLLVCAFIIAQLVSQFDTCHKHYHNVLSLPSRVKLGLGRVRC